MLIEINNNQTLLGLVEVVSGTNVHVKLGDNIHSGISVINGSAYRVGQVGSFVKIPIGYQELYGIVSEVGVAAAPDDEDIMKTNTRWMKVQLVGEALSNSFDRGISQYPNIHDEVHIVTEKDLRKIYSSNNIKYIKIGAISNSEAVDARIDIDKILSRHSAILGTTGSGKSTTVASLLRSIVEEESDGKKFQSARIILLDIHGEYAEALSDIAEIYRINANGRGKELFIPYWGIDPEIIVQFITGGVGDEKTGIIYDKIVKYKIEGIEQNHNTEIDKLSITLNTPLPYSLKRLWYEILDEEIKTFEDQNKTTPALEQEGDPDKMVAPQYKPATTRNTAPYTNTNAPGLKRQANNIKMKLIDNRYNFLLHPGEWEPDKSGKITSDLPNLLKGWIGDEKPITILDLSGIPSVILVHLIGSIMNIIYESLFWARDKSEGAIERPLLVVMEEAHRYLGKNVDGDVSAHSNIAKNIVQRIVKEGRKYGIGAMIVSQRPSEVDETILSQCGTFFALRLSNAKDRSSVEGTLPDNMVNLLEMLPILRTGEAIISGEAAKMPMRCLIRYPGKEKSPNSQDPNVSEKWLIKKRAEKYERVVEAWRTQLSRAKTIEGDEGKMKRTPVESSNLASVGYDATNETLEIEFNSGGIYQYYNVPQGVFDGLMEASSKGEYHADNIKNNYPYSKV